MAKAPEPLGPRLRRLREAAGLSQRAAAAAAGLNRGTLRDLESGDVTDANLSTLRALAACYGVSLTELLGES
jgi:XRE family transcriptional regulator, regulator of sulfur utilization